MEDVKNMYVIPEITPLATSGKTSLVEATKGKIPKLKDVLIKLRKDLDDVGITE